MEMSLTHIAKPPPCLVNKQFLFPNKRREKTICVKALKSSHPKIAATLSTNWDVSGVSSTPAWLPRFEELDTTNMLLRQRIIFLGSQVLYSYLYIYFCGFITQFEKCFFSQWF